MLVLEITSVMSNKHNRVTSVCMCGRYKMSFEWLQTTNKSFLVPMVDQWVKDGLIKYAQCCERGAVSV